MYVLPITDALINILSDVWRFMVPNFELYRFVTWFIAVITFRVVSIYTEHALRLCRMKNAANCMTPHEKTLSLLTHPLSYLFVCKSWVFPHRCCGTCVPRPRQPRDGPPPPSDLTHAYAFVFNLNFYSNNVNDFLLKWNIFSAWSSRMYRV